MNYQSIADCAWRYAQAYASHDTRNMVTVQAVLQARIGLVTCMIAAGWTPPPDLAVAIERDKILLPLTEGSLEWALELPTANDVLDLRADVPQQRVT